MACLFFDYTLLYHRYSLKFFSHRLDIHKALDSCSCFIRKPFCRMQKDFSIDMFQQGSPCEPAPIASHPYLPRDSIAPAIGIIILHQ